MKINTPKILVVDDEPDIERLFQQKLRKQIRGQEFELIFATNGQEALEHIKTNPSIDLVLTDINMPVMDGLTLIGKLQEIDENLKAVVVSAYGDLKNIRIAMNLGAFDFLTKPIDFEDLIITIHKAINSIYKNKENLEKLHHAQTQLIQSEKMSILGQLVAGIAHEINNPTGFVFSNLDCVESYTQDLLELVDLYQQHSPHPDPEIQDKLADIDLDFLIEDLPKMLGSMKLGLERIRNISNSLRIFSRSDTKQKIAFDIHTGIDSTLLILKHRLKANENRPAIEVIKNYGFLPPVTCYPGQLNQVFMNILANAIDAIEEANAACSYQEIKNNPKWIKIQTQSSSDGSNIEIHIEDNGIGMLEEVQQQIFDYLFTTKSVGSGTGLGLSISRQIIVEEHQGTLSCRSKLGEGTAFLILLPLMPPISR